MPTTTQLAVVVPAYNECRLITKTLTQLPAWVDAIVVVDDASTDSTVALVRSLEDPRIHLIEKAENQGVGQAILDGYGLALSLGAQVMVVMAGDNQMDPKDLPAVIEPVSSGTADYVKGNRFLHPRKLDMPRHRRWAGRALAWLTAAASGVPLSDSQCGYTALSRRGAQFLTGADIWPGYGYPNDVLVALARAGFAIQETPVRPIYAEERSGVRFWHALVILWILARRLARNVGTLKGRDRDASLGSQQLEHPAESPLRPR